MSDEVEPAKKQVSKELLVIGGAAASIAVAAAVLATTVFSPQAKADKLYEQGSYAEALEAYESIGNESKNGEKMSDCRYQLVLDYLLTNGTYKASEGDTTWTVEDFSNGDIKCSLAGSLSEKASVGMEISMVITVHHGNTVADLTASSKWKVLNRTLSETGSGTIDLPSYTYDKVITLDGYENSGDHNWHLRDQVELRHDRQDDKEGFPRSRQRQRHGGDAGRPWVYVAFVTAGRETTTSYGMTPRRGEFPSRRHLATVADT